MNEIAPTSLGDWFLFVNVDNTERTNSDIDRVAGGRQINWLGSLDSCSETWRTCFPEKCGLFACVDNMSASDCDRVYIMHSCAQCYCATSFLRTLDFAADRLAFEDQGRPGRGASDRHKSKWHKMNKAIQE